MKQLIIRSKGLLAFLLAWNLHLAAACMAPGAPPDTILLFHPTADNIKTIIFLTDHQFFAVKNVHFLGVYHTKEQYNYSSSEAYIDKHPGIPVSLKEICATLDPQNLYKENEATPEFRKIFKSSVGALFLGGPDIPPETYGEKMNLLTSVEDPYRHYMEISFLFHLLGSSRNPGYLAWMEQEPAYAILGICLGMQTMNVATGGTLIQDIPTEIYGLYTREDLQAANPATVHRNYFYDPPEDTLGFTGYHFHAIQVSKDFFGMQPGELYFKHPLVLSSHHQAIEKQGKGFHATAFSLDGKIIEAIRHDRYPNVLGVQFHPEKTGLYDGRQEFRVSTDSTINFNTYIIEHGSMEFHRSFWEMAGKLFSQH